MTWLERLLIMLWVCLALVCVPMSMRALADVEVARGTTLTPLERIVGGIAGWLIVVVGIGLVLLGIRWVVLG